MVCDGAAPAVFCYIFFTSRHTGGVDSAKLVATGMALPGDAATDDALTDDALTGIFGIDLDLDVGDAPPPAKCASFGRPSPRLRQGGSLNRPGRSR